MTVLITGGAGFLGSLDRRLAGAGRRRVDDGCNRRLEDPAAPAKTIHAIFVKYNIIKFIHLYTGCRKNDILSNYFYVQ